jgi:hypothetical protein
MSTDPIPPPAARARKPRFLLFLGALGLVCALIVVGVGLGVATPGRAVAAPPGAAFNGRVTEIFVNNTQVLIAVTGSVRGSCPGRWGPYNLTFNLSDPAAQEKLALVRDAFIHQRSIAGFVEGCGSSNINRMHQVGIY